MRRSISGVVASAIGAGMVTALVGGVVVARPEVAGAFPGDPDTSFGDCGLVINHGTGLNETQVSLPADEVLASPDGRIWVVGVNRSPYSSGYISVFRYLPNGQLDRSFDDDGHAAVDLRFAPLPDLVAALTPTGGIVVATGNSTGTGNSHSFLVRLTADGVRDTFGGPEGLEVARGTHDPSVKHLEVQEDGSVLALANHTLVRFAPDGARDLTFGTDGVVDYVSSFTAHPDGSLVVSRGVDGISRYSEDGVLDPGFGTDGLALFPRPGWGSADFLEVDPFGNIVGSRGGDWLTLFRMTPTGHLDETFGGDGLVQYRTPEDWVDEPGSTIAIDPQGRPVVASLVHDVSVYTWRGPPMIRLLRFGFTSGGGSGLDPEFGFGGTVYKAVFPRLGVDHGWQGGMVATLDGLVVGVGKDYIQTLLRFEHDPVEAPAGYTLSSWGSLHVWGSSPIDLPPCVPHGPYWEGWDIARGVTTFSDATGGYVLSGWGSLHPYTPYHEVFEPPPVVDGPYWEGWDIARDVALDPSDGGGMILSGWGSLHPFALDWGGPPPPVESGPYWLGWDIARGVAFMPDGLSGYVLDGWGGLHPFVLTGGTAPPPVSGLAYWPGWDIARAVTILPDGTGGYVVDGWGGIHPFSIGGGSRPTAPTIASYWPDWDIVEGITLFEAGASPEPAAAPMATDAAEIAR